jgi:tetratricopeptide (TPR) repeat protein
MSKFFRAGDVFFGFLRSGRNKNNEIVFRPVWGRVLSLLGFLAVTGWLCAALAVMIFVQKSRGFESGRYVDIVFPWRWDHYRTAWGEEFIERGLALLEEGKIREGLHLVRVGHAKSPTNLDGRLVVAELYLASNRPDLAARILRGGLPYATGNMDYVRTTLRVLLANHDDLGVQEIAEEYLPPRPELTPYNQVIALASANAHFFRGNYDRAEDMLLAYGLETNPEGFLLLARLDWERGNRQAALERLEAQVNQGSDKEEIYLLLTRFYRELGDLSRAHNFAVLRQANDPISAGPRIGLLYSHHEAGDHLRVQREAGRILREFGHERETLNALGEFAAHSGDVPLARDVLASLDRRGFPLDAGAILLAETKLKAGQFGEAIQFLETHSRTHEDFGQRFAPVLSGLYAVAYLGMGNQDSGEMYLTQFLNARRMRAESYVLISQRLLALNLTDPARRVMSHAHQIDPLNQTALVELIRLDLVSGRGDDLVGHMEKLMKMRKPPRSLLEESEARLSTDQFLFLRNRDAVLESIHLLMNPAPDLTHS